MAPPLFHLIWNNIVSNLPHWDIFFCKNEWKGGGWRHMESYPCLNKIPNFLHLQVQITSGSLRVSKFLSRESRLFAWQIKPQFFFLGTVYIAHREVKDLPRKQDPLPLLYAPTILINTPPPVAGACLFLCQAAMLAKDVSEMESFYFCS